MSPCKFRGAPAVMTVEQRHACAVAGRVADGTDTLDRHRRHHADTQDVVGLEMVAEGPREVDAIELCHTAL